MMKFVWYSSKKRGVIYSLRLAVSELYFDIKYQTDTILIQPVNRISDVPDEEKAHATHYQASYVNIIKNLFKILSTYTKDTGTFVDLGSGKGRVMILASLQGYKNIIGVEFSHKINQICEDNLAKFKNKTKSSNQFVTTVINAANYKIPNDTSVVFMGNPFDENIMIKVIEQIDQSLKIAPRNLYIAYFNPLHKDLFIQNGFHTISVEKDPSGAFVFQILKKTP